MDGLASIRRAIDECLLLLNRQNTHGHQTEATIVNHGHERDMQSFAAIISHEAFEFEASSLHGKEVAAVDPFPVGLQFEENTCKQDSTDVFTGKMQKGK